MYEYDELSRLVRVNSEPAAYNDGVQTGLPESKTVAYEYDDSGNILSKKTYGWTLAEDLTTLTPTDTITYTYGDSQWKDLLTNYNGTAISYDTIGNPANWRDGMTFSWANGRQLQSVIKDSKTYTFEYNADGIRTKKTTSSGTSSNSVEYVYDESGRIAGLMFNGSLTTVFVYDETGSPIGMRVGTMEFWFTKNLQGDIIHVENSSGSYYADYYYDEWGVPTVVYKNNLSKIMLESKVIFLYRGYVYDWETGFYYLNSRYYDPVVGRFINADGMVSGVGEDIQGYNQFAYCFNNPVNMSDENGNWPKWVETVAKVASVVVAVAAVAVMVTTVASVATGAIVGVAAAKAIGGAAVFLGTALSGINGAVANESKGNSYVNGYVGGATSGFIQAKCSGLGKTSKSSAIGTIVGGGVGVAVGTAVTDILNNIDPDSKNSTPEEIVDNAVTSGSKALITSIPTAYMGIATDLAVSNAAYGLMPTCSNGFGEAVKSFFGWLDDAVVYIWE